MNESSLSRRKFLGTSGTMAAGFTFASLTAASYARAAQATQRLSVGIVGPGGRGTSLLTNFFDVNQECKADLTAVCDIWTRNRERGSHFVEEKSGQKPKQFKRIEELLNEKNLDAVIIATPDHAHAKLLTACLRAGKHVYCEKPFANVLEEANEAIDVCRKSDKVVTLGTQRRSDPLYMTAAELVRSGAVGKVMQCVYVDNVYSPYRWRRKDVNELKAADTDWKTFLLGRSDRKFDPHHYLEFRLYHDFSTGIIDQWMTHKIDTIHFLTGSTKLPLSAVASGSTLAWKDGRENGDTVHVVLEYPEGFQAVYSSTLTNGFGNAAYVLGEQGTVEVENKWQISGAEVTGSKVASKTIERKPGFEGTMDQIHMRDWLNCVHNNKRQTNCTAEHGYQHAIACIMADRALHAGRRMVFDAATRSIREG